MKRLRNILAIIGGISIAILFSSCAAAASPANIKSGEDVKAARELLDSWGGQPDVLARARDILVRVLKANPNDYLALKEVARYQLSAGYIKQRLTRYKGNIYSAGEFAPGTLEQAEMTVRNAIQINPRFAEGYVLLAHIQFQQSKLDQAANSLEIAEAIGTDDPWLHLNWAEIHNAKSEDAAAEERWQRVLRGGDSNMIAKAGAYEYLIRSHMRRGAHDKAVALFLDQIKLDPANAWLRGNFASYLTDTLGRNDEAISQARAALKIMNYGMGRKTLAMALYRKWAELVAQGDVSGGEKYFKEAYENFPQVSHVMVYGASIPGGERLAKALISQKGISVDARAEDESTALLIATNLNHVDVVRVLLDLDANPNARDRTGWTPLLSAADEGNAEIVNMLLAKGADLKATLQGIDAATFAERKGNRDLAEMLRKRAEQPR